MNLLHLKYALEVSKTGSINKAAENLYMNQPNLSRAIKELEALLGTAIFDRSAKGMTLTSDGEEFLHYAKRILKEVDDLEDLFKNDVPKKQKFSISVPRASYISEAFVNFTKGMNSDVPTEIYYKETNALRAINNILYSDYKLGIVRYADVYDRYYKGMFKEKNLNSELISEFKMKLTVAKNHPLAQLSTITIDELSKYTEITHCDPYVPMIPVAELKKDESFEAINKRIFIFERGSQLELLSNNLDTFMFTATLPSETAERFGLIQIDCDVHYKVYKDVLVYKNDYKLSKLDQSFITELCNSKRKVIN